MRKLRLRRLVIRNLRSFSGTHTIEFDDHGLIMIRGKNLDTRGESGAGKSTVLLAIAYLLGYAPYSAKALATRPSLADGPLGVEGHFDSDEGPVVLKRGVKLYIKIGEEEVQGSADAVEKRLDKLCGVNAKLRKALTYRPQGKPGMFLAMKDSEKKRFLVEVLDLHWLEGAIQESSKLLAPLRERVEQAEGLLEVHRQESDRRKEEIVRTPPELMEHLLNLQLELKTRKTEYWELREHLRLEEAKLRNLEDLERDEANKRRSVGIDKIRILQDKAAIRLREFQKGIVVDSNENILVATRNLESCRSRLAVLRGKDQEERAKSLKAARAIEEKRAQMRQSVCDIPRLQKELVEAKHRVSALLGCACPTCKREWNEAPQKLFEAEDEVDKLKELIALNEDIAIQLNGVGKAPEFTPDPKLAQLEQIERGLMETLALERGRAEQHGRELRANEGKAIAEMESEISRAHLTASQEYDQAMNDPNRASLQLKRTVDPLKEQDRIVSLDIAGIQAEIVRLDSQLAHAKDNEERSLRAFTEAEERYLAGIANVAKLRSDYAAESDFLDMLKGFLNKVFDEMLAEIADSTNEMLAGLPNVAHLTMRFDSEYETLKNVLRDEIVPVVMFDGEQRPLESECSGGQYTSVELATDLAVARVVANRRNSDLGWLVLDESFSGHDKITKESCLEILRVYAEDKLVIVVDHASEFKEMFSRTINVEYQQRRSRVVS